MKKTGEVKMGQTRCDYCSALAVHINSETGEAACASCIRNLSGLDKEARVASKPLKSVPPELSNSFQ